MEEDKKLETEFDILNKVNKPVIEVRNNETQFFSLLDGINIRNFSTPVYTTNIPTNPGTEGEIIFVKTSTGTCYLYTFINSLWKRVELT